MRTIDLNWLRLAPGALEAARLEGTLHADWAPAIERARQRRLERAVALSCAGAAGVAVGAAAVLAVDRQLLAAMIAIVVGLVCFAPVLVMLRSGRSMGDRTVEAPAPDPVRTIARGIRRVRPRRGLPVALGVVEPWWAEVAHVAGLRAHEDRPLQEYGDVGESSFVAELSLRLDHDHVAVRNAMVRRRCDADVLVVGPTGIWVFEVKHWTGTFERRDDGSWWRTRTYFAPGGIHTVETTPFKSPPDEQWIYERSAVQETIRRRLPKARELAEQIGGGIVFSHPDANWDGIAGVARSGYGSPAFWSAEVAGSATRPEFTPSLVLEIIDAVLEWHRQLAGDTAGEPRCALQLTQQLSAQATTRAQRYCGEMST
jgi:nuclease-like protein